MAIIQTARNIVYAYDPQPDDVLLSVGWKVPSDDGRGLRALTLRYLPISEYAETVEWAKGLADQLVHPIHVLPLNHNDFFRTARFDPMRAAILSMTDQQRGEMRRVVVTTCCEIMRDCNDPELRTDMFYILRQLKAIYPER